MSSSATLFKAGSSNRRLQMPASAHPHPHSHTPCLCSRVHDSNTRRLAAEGRGGGEAERKEGHRVMRLSTAGIAVGHRWESGWGVGGGGYKWLQPGKIRLERDGRFLLWDGGIAPPFKRKPGGGSHQTQCTGVQVVRLAPVIELLTPARFTRRGWLGNSSNPSTLRLRPLRLTAHAFDPAPAPLERLHALQCPSRTCAPVVLRATRRISNPADDSNVVPSLCRQTWDAITPPKSTTLQWGLV